MEGEREGGKEKRERGREGGNGDHQTLLIYYIYTYNYIPYSRKIWREIYLTIWPPTAEIKYWRNLNLAICDCEAKFQYVILACGYGRN